MLRARARQAATYALGGYFRKSVILGVLIGVVAGCGAIVFVVAIDLATHAGLGMFAGYTPPAPRGEGELAFHAAARPWLYPLVAAAGGLLSGLLVFTLAPEAEGHGTDSAIQAFHHRGGYIRPRIPPIKLLASAITIGSGGSAGREGPTAQISAGFGSWLAGMLGLSQEDRRIAMAVGLGAGIGAIFKAPLGGALLSAEILYTRDFELSALVPGFIASVIGYTIFASWSGWEPVFGGGLGFSFHDPASLPWYAMLGLCAGVAGIAYARFFYATRDVFLRVPLPPHVKPAIGGLLVGIIAIWHGEVLAMGYGWLQAAIEGDTGAIAAGTMVLLVALKIVATSLTIGSGGSGGVFAPGLFIGGMLGGGLWSLLHHRLPGLPAQPEPFVVVGMMALFGGVAKAPIAVMLMVAEMTGEFTMIVPAMMATSVAYLVTGNVSIYEHQLPTRRDSPAHRGEYSMPLIQMLTVADAMQRDEAALRTSDSVAQAEASMTERGVRGMPVLEGDELVGYFTLTDALRAEHGGVRTVGEAMTTNLVVTYPFDSLHTALERMARTGFSRLPVVEPEHPAHLLGVIGLTDLAAVLELQLGALREQPVQALSTLLADPLARMRVGDAMSRQFEVVRHTDRFTEAAALLTKTSQHALLVLDERGNLAGIVTERDLEQALGRQPPPATVGEVATTDLLVAEPQQTLAEILRQPGAELVRQIPVVQRIEGHLVPVGLLRRADVLVAYVSHLAPRAAPRASRSR